MVDEVSFLKEKCQNLLEKISYNEVYSDEFRVLVSKKGKCEWKRDENFSPCSIMIEEFD